MVPLNHMSRGNAWLFKGLPEGYQSEHMTHANSVAADLDNFAVKEIIVTATIHIH